MSGGAYEPHPQQINVNASVVILNVSRFQLQLEGSSHTRDVMLTTMLLNNIARLFDLLMILVAVTLSESALPNSHECVHDRVNVDVYCL